MNLLFGLFVLFFCTMMGLVFSKRFSIRRKFFSDFLQFNIEVKTEISFRENTLINLIDKYKNIESEFHIQIRNFFLKKENVCLNKKIFKDTDETLLLNYLSNLGTTEKASQLKFIESIEDKIKTNAESSKLDEEKYKKLYIKLGFLSGLILFIIML